MARKYDLAKRAASSAATRERILQATVALHAERGIAATSYRDVAERADVGIGSVYHHFPTIDDLVTACGGRLAETTAPPDPSVFAGLRSRRARVERLVSEVFAWYERYPSWRRGVCDADKLEAVARGVAMREARLRVLVTAALGPDPDAGAVDLVRSVVDFEVYRVLVEGGRSTAEAAAAVGGLLLRGMPTAVRPAHRSAKRRA